MISEVGGLTVVAHELKSPLAAMRQLALSMDFQEDGLAELQKTKKQLLADFKELLEGITIVNIKKEVQKSNIQKAELITEDVDYDDYPFIALHLQVNHKIWTSDKILVNGLTEKGYGNFFISTEELKTHLYKKKPKK